LGFASNGVNPSLTPLENIKFLLDLFILVTYNHIILINHI
jgi:hypothetical protein